MEQLARTKRYLKRVEDIYAGIFSSSGHDAEAYDDDVISFFIHCYHVRDWIIHLNDIGITARQVDSYIDSHQALRICADLANGSKHCILTRSLRTARQPLIAGRERNTSFWLVGDGGRGGEVMQSKYTVVSGPEHFDALELAAECVQLWETYIRNFARSISEIQANTSR
ncbi:hypothetical protein [Paraburkholderia azotifigens]|uniref:Uncharacterized protein n=1 Tax=Paraburkholderia azotifigens TaxID=2057004 RepID=A0A5C6V0H0_9BURK|nr:hypothetical protein [Paraburkholderia azotifigens]TXC79123.1 hypothetical protein FRZ40_32410 [Paraburkholderia azotifigens]